MVGSLKWEACFFLLVISVFHTRSEDPWDNCITDAEVTNKVNCNFERNNCAWENMPGNDINWTKIDNSWGNHYMSVFMGSVNVNKSGRVGSPRICNDQGKKHNLKFRYYLWNPRACRLSVYIQSRRNYTFLMDVGTIPHRDFVAVTSPTFYSTDCAFQVIIEAQKIGEDYRYYNEIGIDGIQLSKQQGTVSCTLQTTPIPVSSLQSKSHETSPIMTTPRSNTQEMTTSFTRSYSYSEGLNQATGNESTAAQKRNENYSIQLSPGAIVGIVISLLVITTGIIVVIAYRRNVKDVCDRSGLFKRIKTNTKSNSNLNVPRHVANNSMYSVEDEESTVPTNRIKPHSHGGNVGQNQGYEIPKVTSSYCYSTVQNAEAKRETPHVSGRNFKSATNSDADDYNTLHMTPSNDPQRVAMDAYDHVHTEADLSHKKSVQEDNVYSLARITAHNTDTNASGNSNRNPSPSAIDEYNRLNITRDNFSNGDKQTSDIYDHVDVETDKIGSHTESLPLATPIHHGLSSNNKSNYNHLHVDLSRDQHSHAAKHYDHLETTTDHSPSDPLEGENAYSLADVSFSRDYVNTILNPRAIILSDVD